MTPFTLSLSFQAIDTLFFRELRPQGGPGGMRLQSVFPPPPRTLEGAIRTLLHDLYTPGQAVTRAGASLSGDLCMRGPYLCLPHAGQWQRLYPWPAHILRRAEDAGPGTASLAKLAPTGLAQETDLGRVLLPQLQTADGKPLSGTAARAYHPVREQWLAGTDFFACLHSAACLPQRVWHGEGDLYAREARLGIARNPDARSAQDGQLYQTSHLRPRPELEFALHLGVQGAGAAAEEKLMRLAAHLQAGKIVRLGAEGRSAYLRPLSAEQGQSLQAAPLPPSFASGSGAQVALVFTTPADFGGDWKPANFQAHVEHGVTTWRGYADAAQGIALEIVSVVAGKYQREGGWDSVAGQARDARALLPAGSVWFCRVISGDARALHGAQLGVARELGCGEVALAAW